ncbi:MAG: acyltransferase [Lachnospiraceae bacterium]|nr:acyltransferase [Lachnospiraceae bacterium]
MVAKESMSEGKKQPEKLDYIDGLKVFSCMMIFNFHFINAFYAGFYSLRPEEYHLPALEYFVGSTPLNLIMGGKFGVRMFMTISGFFVGYRFFLTGDKRSLTSGAIKKYLRLVFPILTANIAIYILMKLGLFANAQASALAGTSVYFGNYNQFSPSLPAAVFEAVWGCFATGLNKYNGPLWFIYYEFFGTLLVAAILSLMGNSNARYIAYAVACILGIRTDFLPFLLGCIVCDLTYRPPVWVQKIMSWKIFPVLMWLLFLFGMFLGSFPPMGERLEGTIYEHIPVKVIEYYILGSSCVLYAVLHLESLKKALSKGFVTWLNRCSYGFYLTHFFILCTFSCGFYLALQPYVNYHVIAIANYILTLAVTIGVSMLMKKFVEEPGIVLSNAVAVKLQEKE